MKWYVLLSLVLTLAVYMVIGGVAFHYLEGSEEVGYKNLVKNFTRNFLEQYKCLTEEDLRSMILTYVEAYDRGIIEVANVSSAPNWDLASAMFFSATVFTTIGYGHIYPVTVGGRAFCVVYAIIGIPLCLALLAGIGQRQAKLFQLLDRPLHKCGMSEKKTVVLKIVIIILVGVVAFILLPALMFAHMDGWTYAEATYYCVITLTTIGFGDLVPGTGNGAKEKRSLYRIMSGLWIVVGLAWVAGIIAHMQDLFTGAVEKSIDKIKDKQSQRHKDHVKDHPHVTDSDNYDSPDTNDPDMLVVQAKNDHPSEDIPSKGEEQDLVNHADREEVTGV